VTILDLSDEQRAVAELAREIGMEVLSDSARAAEARGAVPDTVWQTLFDSGLTMPVPEELGGSGIGDASTLLVALENLAYGDAGITLAAVSSGTAALLLARHGTGAHDDTVKRLLTNPHARSAVALYEAHGRGGAEFATTIAVTDNGLVRLSGHKVAVPFADSAEAFVVVGVDATTAIPRAVVVPRKSSGVNVRPYGPTLALGAAAWGSADFDVTLPADSLLGTVEDSDTLLNSVSLLRLAVAAIAVGTAQRSIEYAAHYATERVAFGRPIATFQGVSFPLAEAQMRIDAARLECAELAAALDTSHTGSIDLVGKVSAAVAYATQVAVEATRTAVQTLGGHGYIVEHPVELWYRSATSLSTVDNDPSLSAYQPVL